MTPTPPSTNSSTGARSPDEQFRVVRKRNRVPLSCYPCRSRKLKCDRQHPCSNCTKRDGAGASSCSYAAPVSTKRSQPAADMSPDDMQNRIDRLEGLVLSLMHNGSSIDTNGSSTDRNNSVSQSATDSGSSAKMDRDSEIPAAADEESDDEESISRSLGFLKVDPAKGKSMYIGQEHWHTILADISEVKNYFTSHKEELESSYERVRSSKSAFARDGPTLLLGAVPASEIELRTALPTKSNVLALCSRYFNSMDNAVSIIHGPTFLQQLKAHWQDPEKTPIMWLGLLYSILCLAMLSYNKVGDEPADWKGRSQEMAAEFRMRTVQCLIKADYSRPVEFTIETMLLYTIGEYSVRWDADFGLWLIGSMIIRIAIRMGYHRDGKSFPNVTPFQAEMRRRTWALIRMSDVMFSHQVCLPSMIYEDECDTELPNNLNDDDFHPTIKELPTPRPSSEPTPISYMISKARLCFELGNILQAAHRINRAMPYDEVVRFDAKLRQIMQELPPHLKLTSLEGSNEPITLIIARYNINVLYQRIVCLLHRHYLKRARQNPRYAHSRRRAIEASMQAMEHLATLHRETQANGKLRAVSWYVKSIATREFTLPAMLIILDLHYDNIAMQTNAPQDSEGAFIWNAEQRFKMVSSLQNAKAIWSSLADTSMDAFKASKVLEIMLQKVHTPNTSNEPSPAFPVDFNLDGNMAFDTTNPVANTANMPSFTPGLGGYSPDNNPFASSSTGPFVGMDFGLPPMGLGDYPMNNLPGMNGNPMSPMSMFTSLDTSAESVADFTANFDWGAFENYAQMASLGPDQMFQIYTDQASDPSPSNSGSMN